MANAKGVTLWLFYNVLIAIAMEAEHRVVFLQRVGAAFSRTLLLSWAGKDPVLALVRASFPPPSRINSPRLLWFAQKLGGDTYAMVTA